MNVNPVGGEFEINPADLGGERTAARSDLNLKTFASGRCALRVILRAIVEKNGPLKILIPEYICQSVFQTVRDEKAEFTTYKLSEQLAVKREEFPLPVATTTVVLLVNYFGCVDVESDVAWVKQTHPEAIVIVDSVQAGFDFLKPSAADYAFTSWRKTLAVPDGGQLKFATDRGVGSFGTTSDFSLLRILGGTGKHFVRNAVEKMNEGVFLKLYREAEALLDEAKDPIQASSWFDVLMAKYNLADFAERRRENASFLYSEVTKMGLELVVRFEAEQVPLFAPILLKKRDDVRKALAAQQIYAPVHWPIDDNSIDLGLGKRLAAQELSLVCDQRYSLKHMQRQIDVLKQSLVG